MQIKLNNTNLTLKWRSSVWYTSANSTTNQISLTNKTQGITGKKIDKLYSKPAKGYFVTPQKLHGQKVDEARVSIQYPKKTFIQTYDQSPQTENWQQWTLEHNIMIWHTYIKDLSKTVIKWWKVENGHDNLVSNYSVILTWKRRPTGSWNIFLSTLKLNPTIRNTKLYLS